VKLFSQEFVLAQQQRPKINLKSLQRFTDDTRFYIDFDWWDEVGLDMKTYLSSRLQIGGDLLLEKDSDQIDMVDSKTGEVRSVDGFQFVLQTYFKQLPDDFIKRASLVDAIFCILLGNANQPMTALELAERVQRQPDVVLKTFTGTQIYQGIRPLLED